MKKLLITLSVIMVLSGLGCAALSHYVTPAEIDQGAVGYIVNNGDGHVVDYKGWPFPNLVMAEKLKQDLDDSHEAKQHDLRQIMEDDQLYYGQHSDTVVSNNQQAYAREEALFGERGLLSMGLTVAGFGGFTGLLGLTRKRPGDITPIEAEQAVAQATGQTVAELEAKNKHLFQVVKGVQAFMDVGGSTDTDLMKSMMDRHQDTDTQLAVKAAKVGV